MTEQEQKEITLEDILLNINGINSLFNEFDETKTPKEQANLYHRAAQMVSGGQKEGEEKYDEAITQFTRDPAYAALEIQKYRNILTSHFSEQYEKGKEGIKKTIESKINENLKLAGNHQGNATSLLATYLADTIKIKKVTQAEVDENERQNVLSMGLGYAGIIESKKSVEQYRQVEIRKEASKYLKAINKEDKVTGYVIDPNKLDETMKDIKNAASIYGMVNKIETFKEAAKAKETKQ